MPTENSAQSTSTHVSTLLEALQRGDPQAASELLPLVYDELRKLAAARMKVRSPIETLQPTALVHEAYLRLVDTPPDAPKKQWAHRGHFFAAAAEAMRRILIDNARRKAAVRHGGDVRREALDPNELALAEPSEDLLALDEALKRLAREDPLKAELVKLRYFAGLSLAEAAEVLELSERTAGRHWAFARAWLRREVEGNLEKS